MKLNNPKKDHESNKIKNKSKNETIMIKTKIERLIGDYSRSMI